MKYLIFLFLTFLPSCGSVQDVRDIAQTTRDVAPLIEAGKEIAEDLKGAEGPRDWAGIVEKIAYGVAGVSAIVAGNEVRRRRNKKKREAA